MVLIKVKDIVDRCYTYEDGLRVLDQINNHLTNKNTVTIAFDGITAVSSTFVAGAFLPLLDTIGFDEIRSRVIIINTNKAINTVIINVITNEVNRRQSPEAATRELCTV